MKFRGFPHSVMKGCLEKLVQGKDLTGEEASAVMDTIVRGHADDVQTAAFLVLLAAKGETAEEIAALATTMRSHAVKVHISGPVLDIVGTGGDGHNTVNISTSAAIVAAACGAKVAKHGSKSVSSKSGSSDVLQELGIALLGPGDIASCIDQTGIAFMFAPNFHPAMKHVVGVRRSLQIRTVFNILGPLLNPAGARHLMLGVYTPKLLDTYAEVLVSLGVEHALVVHCCGLDELATVGVAQAVEVRGTKVSRITIDPESMGLNKCEIKDLEGGDAKVNAEIIRGIFSGGDAAEGAIADTICLNAGAALYVYGSVSSIELGFQMAKEKLQSGKVLDKLNEFANISTGLSSFN